MANVLRYRGRDFLPEDVAFVRAFIAQHPDLSRRQLSARLCTAWNWVQPNGALRDMVCRSLLLQWHRAGLLELPAVRFRPPNNALTHRRVPTTLPVDTTLLASSLQDLGPLELRLVRRTAAEGLYAQLLAQYHYLGYSRPVGEYLKYVAWAGTRPVAVAGWGSAPRRLGPRDRWLGWSPAQRDAHRHLLAYNTRFLILPWVRVPSLASHLLARMARQLAADWQALYQHPVYWLETFIEPGRFTGACYRAANWRYLGCSTGLGPRSRTKTPDRPIKQLWVYPLRPDFRQRLGITTPPAHGPD